MTETRHNYIVLADEADQRLDLYLKNQAKVSRAKAQSWISAGCVSINGRIANAHATVRSNDIVAVLVPETKKSEQNFTAPNVVFDCPDYVVIDKPAGLLSHATAKKEASLTTWLVATYPNIAGVGDPARPGIVHRLDRDASGLMVVAKTPEAFAWLQDQFRSRQVLKVYTVLVQGNVQQDEGTIRLALERSRTHHGRMAAKPENTVSARNAVTTYTVLERFTTTTLLSARILTGRTHQIRAHFFAIGHPVVGDTVYSAKKPPRLEILPRVFLHATRLGFSTPDGTWQEYTSTIPQELEKFLVPLKRRPETA